MSPDGVKLTVNTITKVGDVMINFRQMISWLGIAVLMGVAGGSVTVSAKVVTNSFLTTQRQLKTYNSKRTLKLTIPKNTTVQVTGIKHDHGKKYVALNVDRLRYGVRKPLLNAQNTSKVSRWIQANGKNFKLVKKPTYLAYYNITRSTAGHKLLTYVADGNLWQGSALPANYQQQIGVRFTVTTDGYLEYFNQSPYQYVISPKPSMTMKVQKAVHHGRNVDLYFKKSFNQLPLTKVAKKGDNRYRLRIYRTYGDTATAIPDADNASQVALNELYTISGTQFYMHIENARFLGDD